MKLDSAERLRLLLGLAVVVLIGLIVGGAILMFRGDLRRSVSITVLSPRAGLVMNADAKVELLGVQVGRVVSIENRSDGMAVLKLDLDPSVLGQLPDNIGVDISSTTIFGAKYVHLVPPVDPAAQRLAAGAVLESRHVTVEVNTVFQKLTRVLAEIDPPKLNETLGAIAAAFDGRGERIGQAMVDFNRLLGVLEPSFGTLDHVLAVSPEVIDSYADAADDLVSVADNATRIGETFVDKEHDLDVMLAATIGLAGVGDEVLSDNGQPLADLMGLLVPTTALTSEYNPALKCSLQGLAHLMQNSPPMEMPGVVDSVGLTLARERYRYPTHLPKVAATGGPRCAEVFMPSVPANTSPPYIVVDDGADPTEYGNQGILLNSDGLKQMLFGPIAGPPRNSAQIGQPG